MTVPPPVFPLPNDSNPPAQQWVLRPLPLHTVYGALNRLFRLENPQQRDNEVALQLIQKGLSHPHASRQQLQQWPPYLLEQAVQHVVYASLEQSNTPTIQPNAWDKTLQLLKWLEDIQQFAEDAYVSEDLACLQERAVGDLQAYYFKPTHNVETLKAVLQSQGFDIAWYWQQSPTPWLGYWFCRKLSYILPWEALLLNLNDEDDQMYPYLWRMRQQYDALKLGLAPLETIVQLPESLAPLLTISQQTAPSVCRPVKTLVLVEGQTELLVLPAAAKAMGIHLAQSGIQLLAVGGKNQMLQYYLQYSESLRIPICVILDADAHMLLPDLRHYQRDNDQMMILEQGEVEDLYSAALIINTVNEGYSPDKPLDEALWQHVKTGSTAKALQRLWPMLGLGVFDKRDFATHVAAQLTQSRLVSEPLQHVVQTLMEAAACAPNPLD